SVGTLQSLSGAGYPGVPSYDLLGNIIPHISGEEDKIRLETKKILGEAGKPADFGITVHVHRVPVVSGHTIAAHVKFKKAVSIEEVRTVFKKIEASDPNFIKLHSAE